MSEKRNPGAPDNDKASQCLVCLAPIPPAFKYCPRCKRLIYSHHNERSKRRLALQKAWSGEQSAFLCHFTRLPLEEIDRNSPFAIEFDHRIPIKSSDLLATAAFANQLKGDLTEEEFRTAVLQLNNHWKGARFDKAAIPFEYWTHNAKLPKAPKTSKNPEYSAPLPKNCVVCGRKPRKGSIYCNRCRQWTEWAKDGSDRRKALIAAYDKRKHGFICHYTGIELDDKDPTSPWYVSFDRAIPRRKGNLKVAAQWITIMKADLTRKEFRPVIRELAKVFRTGKAFDKARGEFKHWKRRKGVERLFRKSNVRARRNPLGGRLGAARI